MRYQSVHAAWLPVCTILFTTLAIGAEPDTILTPRDLLARGDREFEAGRARQAIVYYSRVLETTQPTVGQRSEALMMRMRALEAIGDHDRSIADSTALINLPDAPRIARRSALLVRGTVYSTTGAHADAINDFTQLVNESDDDPTLKGISLFKRATEYASVGNAQDAIRDCGAVLDVPGSPKSIRFLALSVRGDLRRARGEDKDALKDLSDALAIKDFQTTPKSVRSEVRLSRAMLRLKMGDSSISDDLDEIIADADSTDAQRVFCFGQRGWLKFRKDRDIDGLIEDANQSLRLDDSREVRFRLAIGLLAKGRLTESKAEFEKACHKCTKPEDIEGEAIVPLQQSSDAGLIKKDDAFRENLKLLQSEKSNLGPTTRHSVPPQ